MLKNLNRKHEDKKVPNKKSKSFDFNPFLPYDPEMFVENISPTHVCLLNKYNVVDDHILLVTREFEEQSSLLTFADFSALWKCLVRFDSLAFYNAGQVAGASQRHKHLQLIPTPIIPDSEIGIPFDNVLARKAHLEEAFSAPELPFLHRCASLRDCCDIENRKAAEVSMQRYTGLLHELSRELSLMPSKNGDNQLQVSFGDRQPFAYNLLITREWMLMVPRAKEECRGISINSLGFAGSLFVRDEDQLRLVKEIGPMNVLEEVAFAKPSTH